MSTERKGDWLQTFSGVQFWPLDPRVEEVWIDDIAHSLAMQCRFNGHCLNFYSVAEHCVHLSRAVSAQHALWALLHDAAEAYVTDVPRPLKPSLAGYADIEAKVQRVICERFRLPIEIPTEVYDADRAILTDEATQNMASPPVRWATHGKPLGVVLDFWRPEKAKKHFLERFVELT